MGVMYSVFPLEEKMHGWLEEQAIAFPTALSRNPTLVELQEVIASLESHTATQSPGEVGAPWEALVTRNGDANGQSWFVVRILHLTEGENDFYFDKGAPELIIEVLIRLAVKTGPLVLVSDAGDPPLVIQAGKSAKDLFQSWGS
jgi:hypothetical protein